VNWVTESWRLKLLALGLSVLMLGAVAFSQNPPTSRTLQVSIVYTVPAALILINPPTKTTVTVTGLADSIRLVSASCSCVVATVDLTKANPGPSVSVNMVVKSLISGTQVANPTVPIALNVDRLASVTLTVQARTPRGAALGWKITKSEAVCPNAPSNAPCTVTFTGPSTWETGLNAYADFPSPVQNPTSDVVNQPVVVVQKNGQPLDLTVLTVPVGVTSLDPSTVAIHIEAKTGTSSRQVVLIDSPPSHGPPTGYRVTNIAIDPITVVVSGAPDALAKITTLTLPAVDLSGRTSGFTFRVTIPYPSGVTGSVQIARVTYAISANPSARASPTP
jgi:YbbR domain-containing protein